MDSPQPPKITVLTPSYNQGRFLEDTILSVLGQNYVELEYMIIDGCSNDNSLEIIRRYDNRIDYWVSEADRGQSHAINKGFSRATGDILCWLNSDDMLLPGVLKSLPSSLDVSKPEIHFGNCIHLADGTGRAWGSDVKSLHMKHDLRASDYIIQPSTFWTRKAWEITGPLDEGLHYGFDWDWFIRAMNAGITFKATDQCQSIYRIHDYHKSATGGDKRISELALIYDRYLGAEWRDCFLQCYKLSDRYAGIAKWAHRLRLGKYSSSICRLLLWRSLSRYNADQIRDVLTMM